MRGRGKRAIGLLLLLLALRPLSAAAQGTLPPDVVAQIQQTARAAEALARSDAALADGLNNPELAAVIIRRADERTADAMSAAVVSAIARNPAHAAAIVAVASAAAPQYRDRIAADAAQAFPGFFGALPAISAEFAAPSPIYEAAPTFAAAPAPEIEAAVGIEPIDDPLEPFNRGVFFVNDQLDTYLFRPIAWTYGLVTPDPAKQAVRRAFLNLRSPVRFANDLLQGEIRDAGVTGARFLINSSVGVAGLFDVAARLGHPHHPSDFGQTLHVYGMGPGPYIVIPVLGPSTSRDGVGRVVDILFDPFTYLLDIVPEDLALKTGEGLVRREELIDTLDDVKATSVDYYAGVRSLYYQDRAVELRRGKPADTSALDEEFESFE